VQQRLQRYLGRFLKRKEDVEDISQEAFLKVLEAESEGRVRHREAYLYRTAKHLALNSLSRKSNVLVDYIEEIAGADVFNTRALEDDVMAREHFEHFCRAVAQLPEQCRRVFVLRKVYGLSQQEVADHLGLSQSTVEKHLAKRLIRCGNHLASLGLADTDTTRKRRQP
jgi:RNA polymerase sigma-70 factor (ECF subfamily)